VRVRRRLLQSPSYALKYLSWDSPTEEHK
jgi:hypothetical protein